MYVTCRLDCFSPGVTWPGGLGTRTGLLFTRSHMARWSGHEITATHPTGCTLTYTMTPTPTPSLSTVYIDHYIDTLNANIDNIKHVHRKYILPYTK